jgi:hypothetical protein
MCLLQPALLQLQPPLLLLPCYLLQLLARLLL